MSRKKTYTILGKDFRKTIEDIFDRICQQSASVDNRECNPTARMCILTLIALTLIFSGVGIISWIILVTLYSLLRYV